MYILCKCAVSILCGGAGCVCCDTHTHTRTTHTHTHTYIYTLQVRCECLMRRCLSCVLWAGCSHRLILLIGIILCLHTHTCLHAYMYFCLFKTQFGVLGYGLASISRLLKIIGLFCIRAL